MILTVVISVLLAVIAVLFILRTSVDSVGTMSVSDNKELSYAAETVLTQLTRELVLDVPGVKTLTQPLGQEYQDYPWTNAAVGPADPLWKLDDRWLANLEPYRSGSRYYWRHVSDLYGDRGTACNDLRIYDSDPNAPVNGIVSDGAVTAAGNLADADGDGVADSVWVQAMAASSTPLRTSKGKQMYLALRVVDLGGMLNANTAYRFDPTSVFESRVDGSSVTQVNLFGLSLRGSTSNPMQKLRDKLIGSEPNFILSDYETMVAKRLDSPQGRYSPFGINEELKLRYRYMLDFNAATTRMDNNPGMDFWADAWEGGINMPSSSLTGWQPRVTRRDIVPAETADITDLMGYDYRHITTTFNCDRLIDPNGQNMTNVNTATAQTIYNRLGVVMPAADPNVLAQLAVNIKDYRDGNEQVTAFNPTPPVNPADPNKVFYGHSSPFMWISEIAFSQTTTTVPPAVYKSYAIELFVPTNMLATTDYQLVVDGIPYALPSATTWGGQCLTLLNEDAGSPLTMTDANSTLGLTPTITFAAGSVIQLRRLASNGVYVTVDSLPMPLPAGLLAVDGLGNTAPGGQSMQRDVSEGGCIRKLWDVPSTSLTLGVKNPYVAGGAQIQYATLDAPFVTIGDLGRVLKVATNDVGPLNSEVDVRFDWTLSPFSDVARYFTVMAAPAVAGDRIYGRVNINTAPYFVLAQLPWMQYNYPMASTDPNRFARSRDVIARRESVNGFRSVADVLLTPRMRDLATGGVSLPPPPGSPDLSFDTVIDDFEERDIIFSRISNLATVRSDVFCAYILIRLGEDGPQKRVMVILDRSGVRSSTDKVKVRAFHPVPDPR